MKSSKFLSFIFFMFFLSSVVNSQTINIPPNHGTAGALNPPIGIDPNVQLDVWSIVKNSECDLQITLWFTINGEDKSLTTTVNSGGSASFSSIEVLALFGLNSISSVTHSSMNIVQATSPNSQIGVAYPGDNERKSDNTIEEGCDCVHVDWNLTTRVITISNC